ncbi:MAG: lipoate protein ligase C-terminal domain-containing protein [Thermoplasmata archaeon]|nr:lipoate protein ligase C-terminal domain-containing protein [Thermoplasmata archaeon]
MKFEYKGKGSKLIRLEIEWKNDKINRINIYGDFFLHPEESIFDLEKELINKDKNEIKEILNNFFKKVEYAGIDPDTLYDAIISSLVK